MLDLDVNMSAVSLMQECIHLPDSGVLGVLNQRVILEPWVVGLEWRWFCIKARARSL